MDRSGPRRAGGQEQAGPGAGGQEQAGPGGRRVDRSGGRARALTSALLQQQLHVLLVLLLLHGQLAVHLQPLPLQRHLQPVDQPLLLLQLHLQLGEGDLLLVLLFSERHYLSRSQTRSAPSAGSLHQVVPDRGQLSSRLATTAPPQISLEHHRGVPLSQDGLRHRDSVRGSDFPMTRVRSQDEARVLSPPQAPPSSQAPLLPGGASSCGVSLLPALLSLALLTLQAESLRLWGPVPCAVGFSSVPASTPAR